MSVTRKLILALGCAGLLAIAQLPPSDDPLRPNGNEPKLPDGRSQREAILKADHEKSLKDVDELIRMSEALKMDLEKNDRHVLSIATLKTLDDIEKTTKRIRGRLKRF